MTKGSVEHPAYDPPLAGLRPGDPVRGRYTKWGGRRHHGGELVYLGSDEHGHWLGDPVGSVWSGGPASFTAVTDNVLLIPRGRGHTGMFYERHPDLHFRLYCDITTEPQWLPDPPTVTAVDLDLDVIAPLDSPAWVDDEDEFAEHQVSLAYPCEVVAAAQAECDRVLSDVRAGVAWTRAETAEPWRVVLRALLAGPGPDTGRGRPT